MQKGSRVRSVGPTSWPVGTVKEGTIIGVEGIAPLGEVIERAYWVGWDDGQISGPLFENDLIAVN